ncbi:hypothetical protein IJJ05_02625 [Candidatus Saccharibacteria bacterium]|nr:hypothetical protein [Candidatus Saccharibacteria bacterium]
MSTSIKRGKVDYSVLKKAPELHEIDTAEYFADKGLDVVFLRPSNIKGSKSPDFEMAGKIWETKSPITFSNSSFEDNFKTAEKQSKHIIFDLRRLNKRSETFYIKNLKKRSRTNIIKTLLVIDKTGNLLTIKGKFDNIKP